MKIGKVLEAHAGSCSHIGLVCRIFEWKLYEQSNSDSGGVAKLLVDLNLYAAFLKKGRAELIKRHNLDSFPLPPAD